MQRLKPMASCKSCKPRERQGDQEVTRNLVVLPYAKGASEKITRVLNQHNIKVAHKPVGSFFRISARAIAFGRN